MKSFRIVAFVLAGLSLSVPAVADVPAAAPAPTAVAPGAVIAVVPFAESGGETVDADTVADNALVAGLTKLGQRPVLAAIVRHLDVPTTAKAICAASGATAIAVGSMRTEQNLKVTYAVFTDITHYPTHGEVRLTLLDCHGRPLWRAVGMGDKDHYGSNVGAAVSEVAELGVGTALATFPATIPSVPLPVAPIVAGTPGAALVIVPVGEPGSADPMLDEATNDLVKAAATANVNAVVAPPTDRFDAVNSAAELCAAYGAKGFLYGTLRTEQSFANFLRSHAEIWISQVGCDGTVLWTEHDTGENIHRGANFRSGVSAALTAAFVAAGPNLTARLQGLPVPSPSPSPTPAP
jgi:hypothetical protein